MYLGREALLEPVLLCCKKQQGETFKCNEYNTWLREMFDWFVIRNWNIQLINQKNGNATSYISSSDGLKLSSLKTDESGSRKQNSSETEKPNQSISRETTVSATEVIDENALMVGWVVGIPTAPEICIPVKKPAKTKTRCQVRSSFR